MEGSAKWLNLKKRKDKKKKVSTCTELLQTILQILEDIPLGKLQKEWNVNEVFKMRENMINSAF